MKTLTQIDELRNRIKGAINDVLGELYPDTEDGKLPFVGLFVGDNDSGISFSSNAGEENAEAVLATIAGYVTQVTGGVFMFPVHHHEDVVGEAESILANTPQPFHPGVAPGFTETPPEPEHDHDRFSDDGNPHHGE